VLAVGIIGFMKALIRAAAVTIQGGILTPQLFTLLRGNMIKIRVLDGDKIIKPVVKCPYCGEGIRITKSGASSHRWASVRDCSYYGCKHNQSWCTGAGFLTEHILFTQR